MRRKSPAILPTISVIPFVVILALSSREVGVRGQAIPLAVGPTATLSPAPTMSLPAVDSNSPVVWERVRGRPRMHVFTSFAGWPTRSFGPQLSSLTQQSRIAFDDPGPLHGVWFEAVIPDVDGTWYGYYHNEYPADMCGDLVHTVPRIGAAKSTDFGETWEDLGTILEAPTGTYDCATVNRYFVGGVGDFSVLPDPAHQYLYFFFSQYADRERTQGVSVARLRWADRDAPRGRMSVWWRGSIWAPVRVDRMDQERFVYPGGMPIYPATVGWHDSQQVDAFWGPSVHWNTYLQQYVMLLNHAQDVAFRQEGIYIAYSSRLDDPASWSTPRKLLTGGRWYPQVIGVELESGSDRLAGQRARFFMSGVSFYEIVFEK